MEGSGYRLVTANDLGNNKLCFDYTERNENTKNGIINVCDTFTDLLNSLYDG